VGSAERAGAAAGGVVGGGGSAGRCSFSGELVPAPATALEPRLGDRLDAFAQSAPTLREAFASVGRAFARKAVRLVVWRRRPA
jgi:hypothetical protein